MSVSLGVAILVIGGWIFSLCFHEFGHAITAYIGGDKSVKDKGYLTFNPFAYTNLGLSIVLPTLFLLLGGVGLPGAAVRIDTSKLRSRHWNSIVSLAGPLFSFVFTILLVVTERTAMSMLSASSIEASDNVSIFQPIVFLTAGAYLAKLQMVVLFLNLLPVPGLDGFGIIEPYLPRSVRNRLAPLYRYGFGIVFLLLFAIPPLNTLLWGTANSVVLSMGISRALLEAGRAFYRQGATPIALGCIALATIVYLVGKRTKAISDGDKFASERN